MSVALPTIRTHLGFSFAAHKFIASRHLIDIDILFLTEGEASMKLGQ